jgi:hypothetical protein
MYTAAYGEAWASPKLRPSMDKRTYQKRLLGLNKNVPAWDDGTMKLTDITFSGAGMEMTLGDTAVTIGGR